jgi:hypothetical protein
MQRRRCRNRELKPALSIRAFIEAGARSPADVTSRQRRWLLAATSRAALHQIASALNAAVVKQEYPKRQGRAAKEATSLLQAELDKLAAIRGGNLASPVWRAGAGKSSRERK